jgi:hypothetical protein
MTDRREWVQAHRVCWEVEPLRELTKGHGVQQTGYELKLFARLDPRPKDETDRAVLAVHDGLRELALDALASHPEPHAIIAVQPFDRAIHLRPESGFAAEIELSVLAYPRHRDEPLRAAEAQKRIAALEDKLREMALERCPRPTLADVARSRTTRSRVR